MQVFCCVGSSGTSKAKPALRGFFINGPSLWVDRARSLFRYRFGSFLAKIAACVLESGALRASQFQVLPSQVVSTVFSQRRRYLLEHRFLVVALGSSP